MNRLQDTLASDPAPQHFTHSDEIVTEWVPSSKGMAWEKADSTCAREAKITSSNCWPYWSVLGLARTGLIFTGLQEGAQPRGWGLTPPGQTEPGIPYRVTLGSGGGGGAAGTHSRGSGACGAGTVQESGSVFCRVFSLFVSLLLLFPLFAVLLNCPYPDPPVFCLFSFHSPPHRGGGRGGRMALLLPAAAETKTWRLSARPPVIGYILERQGLQEAEHQSIE